MQYVALPFTRPVVILSRVGSHPTITLMIFDNIDQPAGIAGNLPFLQAPTLWKLSIEFAACWDCVGDCAAVLNCYWVTVTNMLSFVKQPIKCPRLCLNQRSRIRTCFSCSQWIYKPLWPYWTATNFKHLTKWDKCASDSSGTLKFCNKFALGGKTGDEVVLDYIYLAFASASIGHSILIVHYAAYN